MAATRHRLRQKHLPIRMLHSAAFTVAPCSETPSDECPASQYNVDGISLGFNSNNEIHQADYLSVAPGTVMNRRTGVLMQRNFSKPRRATTVQREARHLPRCPGSVCCRAAARSVELAMLQSRARYYPESRSHIGAHSCWDPAAQHSSWCWYVHQPSGRCTTVQIRSTATV